MDKNEKVYGRPVDLLELADGSLLFLMMPLEKFIELATNKADRQITE